MSGFKPVHILFDSVEAMLAPKNLTALLGRPVTSALAYAMDGSTGLSGARLQFVDTDAGRFVLKRMSPVYDFAMFVSRDYRCRSVALWQYGILDQLAPLSRHGILAAAKEGSGWAILLEDLSCCLLSHEDPPPPDVHHRLLDSLADMHARFWEDARLQAPELGLLTMDEVIGIMAWGAKPESEGIDMGELPIWLRDGWNYLDQILEPDVHAGVKDLILHPQPFFDAIARYPFTLVHGDYRYGNLAFRDVPYIFDWQIASFSLCTIGLAWFMGNNHPVEENALYYRQQLESRLGRTFEDGTWQDMLDLGLAAHAFRSLCFGSYWTKNAEPESLDDMRQITIKRANQLLDIRRLF